MVLHTILFSLNLWSLTAFAAETCPEFKLPKDIFSCALINHPKVVRVRSSLDQVKEQVEVAKQWKNPELDSKAVTGSSLGDRIIEAEVSLALPIELGGKQGSRVERAEAEIASADASLSIAHQEVAEEVILSLARLRQIASELEIVTEALHTFGTIGSQFKSRPRLTPEQQVSFGIFLLAEGDYKLKKAALITEQETLRRQLELATGRSIDLNAQILPAVKTKWPEVLADAAINFQDGITREGEAQLKLSNAEYSVAKSESWPDLKIGPVFQYSAQGGINYPSVGLSLSLPLPIFSQNGGSRGYAYKGVLKSETSLALLRKEKKSEYEALGLRYTRSIKVLSELISVLEVERKHKNIESLFAKGLIGGPSVIETHRQILDFTKGKHEHEQIARLALIKISFLKGLPPEEAL